MVNNEVNWQEAKRDKDHLDAETYPPCLTAL